jgi:dipeptidyl-peptidase-4
MRFPRLCSFQRGFRGRMAQQLFPVVVWASLGAGEWPCGLGRGATAGELPTMAESTGYGCTALPEEVHAFLRRLQEQCRALQLKQLTTTVEGRPLIAACLNPAGQSFPQEPAVPVVLLGGLHANECDGKEALLALLRDAALAPKPAAWQQRLELLVVPDANPDGNARRGPWAPLQGPDGGVGRKTNAQRIDLYEDFVRLQSPEARAIVRFVRQAQPVLVIDTHTSDEPVPGYDLLFDVPHHPAVAESLKSLLRQQLLASVNDRLQKEGIRVFYDGRLSPDRKQWRARSMETRFGLEYLGLSGIPTVTFTAVPQQPFARRLEVLQAALKATLETVAERADHLLAVVETLRKDSLGGISQEIPIAGVLRSLGPLSTKTACPETGQVRETTVDYYGDGMATRSVPKPFGYLLSPGESRIADRLLKHGIPLQRLTKELTLDVTGFRVVAVRRAGTASSSGELVELEVQAERVQGFQALPGTYFIPVQGPLGVLTVNLLEPESQDGLARWNFFAHVQRPGQLLPLFRLDQPTEVKNRSPVAEVPAAQLLELDQLFGPDAMVPWAGRSLPAVKWLGDATYLIRTADGWLRGDAARGAETPAYDVEELERAWQAVPGLSPEEASRLARHGWDELAPNGKGGLVAFRNDLYWCDLGNRVVRRITHDLDEEELATFSPDSGWVAYVKEYNLFVADPRSGEAWSLTSGGSEAKRYGKLDWVYQEELYGRGNYKGFWWSPDSKKIAFLFLDEEGVTRFPIVHYNRLGFFVERLYYPRAGEPLPKVKVGIVSVGGGPVTWVDTSRYGPEEHLVVRVSWGPDSARLFLQIQDRRQRWLELVEADAHTGQTQPRVRETSPAWVEVLGEPIWISSEEFLWLSDRSGNRHIYRLARDGRILGQVTAGDWDVEAICGYDKAHRCVYFVGYKESPLVRHLYRACLDGGSPQRISEETGHHDVDMAPGCAYYFDRWSDLLAPPRLWLYRADQTSRWAVEPNLDDYLQYCQLGQLRFYQVPARDGFLLDCLAILPPDFRENRQYPVLCYVYGGPQAPVVQHRWMGPRFLWFHLLARRGLVVWLVDNRASTRRGMKHAWPIYGQLGVLELQDVVDSLQWLTCQAWVDKRRMAIFGWSYGGYLSALALASTDLFKLGISGAPVTDWRYYDAIYTERYMKTPQENPRGYEGTSIVGNAEHLRGKVVLVHGTVDDNVHLWNTLQLVDALQRAGKPFELMLYPGSRHGVTDPQQVRHLYGFLTDVLAHELGLSGGGPVPEAERQGAAEGSCGPAGQTGETADRRPTSAGPAAKEF